MSYKSSATALLDMLLAKTPASDFVKTANSSDKSDWGLLDRGQNVVVVFEPGAAPRVPGADTDAFGDYYQMDWIVNVHVIAKIKQRMPALHDALVDTANAIIDTIDRFPFLNAATNIEIAFHGGWEEPAPTYDAAGNGPHGVGTVVPVTIREQILNVAQE